MARSVGLVLGEREHKLPRKFVVICQKHFHSKFIDPSRRISCQLFRMRFRIGWKQQPAVPVPTWFATIHVARQPQIACLPLICLYIHSLLSLVYIDQNAIIECRICVLDRDQPESNSFGLITRMWQTSWTSQT